MRERQIILGGVLAGLGTIVSVVANLLLTPYLINRLGADSYGVWTLVLSLSVAQGVLSFLDLGILSSVIKLVAGFQAERRWDALNGVVSAALICFITFGFCAAVGLVFSSSWLVEAGFLLPVQLAEVARVLINLLAMQVIVDVVRLVFTAVLQGLQVHVVHKSLLILHTVFYVVSSLCLIQFDLGLYALGLAALLTSVLHAICALVSLKLALKSWNIFTCPSCEDFRHLLKLSSVIVFIRIQSAIFRSMDRIILGFFASAVVVAQYDIISKLAGLGLMAVTIVSSLIISPASEFYTVNDLSRLRMIYFRSTKYSCILCFPVILILFLFAEDIISAWVGPEFTLIAGVLRVYLLYVLIVAFVASGQNILIGGGHCGVVALISSGATILNLFLSLIFAKRFLITGIVWGTVISMVIGGIFYFWAFRKYIKVNMEQVWDGLFKKILYPPIGALFVYFPLGFLYLNGQFSRVVVVAVTMATVYCLLVIRFSLDRSEIARLLTAICPWKS